MKFFSGALTILPFVFSAAAQTAYIGSPTAGANLRPNQKFTVQIVRPDTLTGSTEAGLVIALQSCSLGPCRTPTEQMGTVLFNGHFNPQFQQGSSGPPYQNFTVTIPSNTPLGSAQLATARFYLVGGGPAPILETNSVAVNITSPLVSSRIRRRV